ncbi:MAG: GTP pyrophosphokinase family protein [Candidatus Binataceae bacterium]
MTEQEPSAIQFDFAAFERAAISAYLPKQRFYENLANAVAMILEARLKKREIKVLSVQHRAKDPASFGRKAAIPSESDPNSPKYLDPLKDITDLAGVRVISHFPATLADIDQILIEEFDVVERSDKGKELIQEERFGYQSVHYLVRVKAERARLAEYHGFAGAVAEVQVRTILQHAWAEIEHDIQYKSSRTIPSEIRRRFMALAGMLEIGDREFQAIQDANKQLEDRAKAVVVEGGNLSGVEITPSALKSLLDKKLGPDERISDWAYDWTTRLLKQLGFRDLKQVETAIAPFNDDQLSKLAMGARQGQTTRFELMLLASLGERFIERHTYKGQDWFDGRYGEYLRKFREAGVKISNYDPESVTVSPPAS